MSQIIDHLYLGSKYDAENLQFLHDNAITIVISFVFTEPKVIYKGITYHHFPMFDDERASDPLMYYDKVKVILDECLKSQKTSWFIVLVVCLVLQQMWLRI